MGEVVRLVSGAGLGIHAGWQALVGGGLRPASSVGKAILGCFVFHPRRRPRRMGVGGTAGVRLGKPSFGCEPAVWQLLTPPVPSPLCRGPDVGREYLEE